MTTIAGARPAPPRKDSRMRETGMEWWKIGPKRAAELLETSSVNRRVRQRHMQALAQDMREGEWRDAGDAIKISRTGKLLDGQHRLAAVVETGMTVEFRVVTGLPDEAQVLMDQGATRTAHDVLGMAGFSYTTLTAGVARWVLMGGEPGPHLEAALKQKASTARILRIAREQPDIELAASKFSSLSGHVSGSPTAICYSWLWMHRVDTYATDDFFGGIIDMNFKALKDPRKAMLRALARMEREEGIGPSSKDKAFVTVSLLTRAWNAWRAGEEVDAFPLKRGGKIIPPVKPV